MMTYKSVMGVCFALKDYFKREIALAAELPANADATILSSADLKKGPGATDNRIGIFLHRVSIDPHGRGRYLKPGSVMSSYHPELPVNLHLLLIAWSENAEGGIDMLAWAMQLMGGGMELDSTDMAKLDSQWGDNDKVQIIPEDMSTEDLLRIWEGLPQSYMLSTPYIIKTIRLEAVDREQVYDPVEAIVIHAGETG